MYGECSFFIGRQASHTKLRDDLENLRGSSAAIGLYPPWLEDTEDVISAYVPNEDGVVRPEAIDT
jgi:hypothetical protein